MPGNAASTNVSLRTYLRLRAAHDGIHPPPPWSVRADPYNGKDPADDDLSAMAWQVGYPNLKPGSVSGFGRATHNVVTLHVASLQNEEIRPAIPRNSVCLVGHQLVSRTIYSRSRFSKLRSGCSTHGVCGFTVCLNVPARYTPVRRVMWTAVHINGD